MGHHDCYVCGKDLGGVYQHHWDRKCHMECHPDNVAAKQERERFKEIGRKEAQSRIAELEAEVALMSDPQAVFVCMMSGNIALPTWDQIKHVYPNQSNADLTPQWRPIGAWSKTMGEEWCAFIRRMPNSREWMRCDRAHATHFMHLTPPND